jgi:hypothetical protein
VGPEAMDNDEAGLNQRWRTCGVQRQKLCAPPSRVQAVPKKERKPQ